MFQTNKLSPCASVQSSGSNYYDYASKWSKWVFFSSEVNDGGRASFQEVTVDCSSAVGESRAVYVDRRHENKGSKKVHLVTNVTLICITAALSADGGLKNWTLVLWLVNEVDWPQFIRYFRALVSPLFSP